MEYHKKVLLCTVAFVLILGSFAVFLPKEKSEAFTDLKIGAGDDITGLIVKQLGLSTVEDNYSPPIDLSSYYFADC